MAGRLRNGLAGLLLAGASAGLGGCAQQRAVDAYHKGLISYDHVLGAQNQDNAMAWSLLGGGLSALGAHKGKPEGIYMGQALSSHGSAMASKDNLTVNVMPPQISPLSSVNNTQQQISYDQHNRPHLADDGLIRKQHSELGSVVLGACNFCMDFNNNGFLDYPEDYNGVKKVFSVGERVVLVIGTSRPVRNLRIDLFDRNGEPVKTTQSEILSAYKIEELKNLSKGNYAAAFYGGGEFLGKTEFTVKDKVEVILK